MLSFLKKLVKNILRTKHSRSHLASIGGYNFAYTCEGFFLGITLGNGPCSYYNDAWCRPSPRLPRGPWSPLTFRACL